MASARKSLISGPIPRYRKLYEGERWQPKPEDDWDPNIPYGGKVYLARKKLPQSWFMTLIEVICIVAIAAFCLYAYYYFEHLHFHALRLVANTGGSADAQHFVGQRYLHVCLAYICFYHFDHLHFHVARGYAKLGFPDAQHRVGQHYLSGKGVDKDHKKAMEYFKAAAEQGHPHASHNLAVGHLKGMHRLPPGEAHRLIQHAAANGVPEAQDALNGVCVDEGCQ